ncbi:MAG: outer membrane beta-barrel protein [Pseudomonadota bacterium]
MMRVLHSSEACSCSACNGLSSKLVCCVSLLCLSAPLTSFAQATAGALELTPYGGYRFGGTFEDKDLDASAELDDTTAFGLILNLRESDNTQWEVIYARQSTTADVGEFDASASSIDLKLHSVQLGGTYIGDGKLARPYLAATLGGTYVSPGAADLNSDTFWSFSIGTGLQVFPDKRLGMRLEARAWGTFIGSDSRLFCSSGPQGGLCAITVSGDMLWQVETFAGIVFRF